MSETSESCPLENSKSDEYTFVEKGVEGLDIHKNDLEPPVDHDKVDMNNVSDTVIVNSVNSETEKLKDEENVCENANDDQDSNSTLEGRDSEELSHSDSTKSFSLGTDIPRLTEEDGWLDIIGSGDFKKRVIKPGNGVDTRPQQGNLIQVKYTCYDENNKIIEQEDDFQFIIGDLDVVQGLDLAAPLIEQGEVAELLIPSRLAYGKIGREPDVPPDTSLRYIIELLNVEDLSEDIPVARKLQFGNQKRDRGNFWYGRGEYLNAIHSYERAAEYLDSIHDGSENPSEMLQNILDSRIKIYNNMAAAHMKLEAYDPALKSLQFVLKIQPKNVKALYRKGKILGIKGRTSEAIVALKYASELEPETKIIQHELSKLIIKKRNEDESTKALYKRMFQPIVSEPKPSKLKSWVKRWSLMAGSCIVVAVGIAAYRQFSS